jgi:hypothetical protein
LLNRYRFTFVVFTALLEESKLLRLLFVFFPRRITVDHIEFAKLRQIILLDICFDIDWRMISLLGPAILLLHEQRHPGIFDISNSRINILNEILRTLSRLDILGVEAVILGEEMRTYLRIKFSLVEYGMLIVGLLFIYYNQRMKQKIRQIIEAPFMSISR